MKRAITLGGLSLLFGAYASATTLGFTNFDGITIPAGAPSTTSGPGDPYPSTVTVAGFSNFALITDITLSLGGLTHTFPDDLDMLLVGPTGASLLFLSDAGGSADVSGCNLTFSDSAGSAAPDSTALICGSTYLPTNYGTGDTFPGPAPGGPYGSAFSAFLGTNPNGVWSLYINDDVGLDSGSLSNWGLVISAETVVPEPATVSMIGLGLLGIGLLGRRRRSQR